jgi:threonine dehydrogenase-like Zn-dependent dehydrogenase
MRAAVFDEPGKWHVEQRGSPSAGPGQVLIAVQAAGVCRTDTHIFHGKFPASFPRVLGHEFAGVVESVGEGVSGIEPGSLVSVDPVIPCRVCEYCRRSKPHLCRSMKALGIDIDGGFATHALAPVENVYPVPETVPVEEAALAEPLACCLHGIDLAPIEPGDRVAIIGAGWIGLLMLQVARLSGAGSVMVAEKQAHKISLARELGAGLVVDAKHADAHQRLKEALGEGADLVMECVGSAQTSKAAVRLVRDGGTVLIFGVAPQEDEMMMRPYEIYRREIRIIGSFSTPRKHAAALSLLAGKRLRMDALITGRFDLRGVGDAMQALESGRAVKSLIVPA